MYKSVLYVFISDIEIFNCICMFIICNIKIFNIKVCISDIFDIEIFIYIYMYSCISIIFDIEIFRYIGDIGLIVIL